MDIFILFFYCIWIYNTGIQIKHLLIINHEEIILKQFLGLCVILLFSLEADLHANEMSVLAHFYTEN